MGRDPNEKICGRCGSGVFEDIVRGELVERCLCLVRFGDERMPSAWHFEYDRVPVSR